VLHQTPEMTCGGRKGRARGRNGRRNRDGEGGRGREVRGREVYLLKYKFNTGLWA